MSAVADPPWVVVETPCFPRKFKVVRQGQHDKNGSSSNNSWTEYYCHYEDAAREARDRNRVWPVITKCLVECMRRDTANYEDLLLRWCAAKRDYPAFDVPEPPMPPGLDLRELRARTIAEFNRTL